MNQQSHKCVALLPMKANSERVPGKNFRLIAGKPLFRWVLDALLEVSQIECVVINTDAVEILAENSLQNGDHDGRVIIRERKSEICGDTVSMNRVLADDIQAIPSQLYLMTHTTNPLLSAATIEAILDTFSKSTSKDSLFTVNRLQTRFYDKDAQPINHDPKNLIPTQDLNPYFEENSVAYLFTRESFDKTGARIGEQPLMYETPPLESVDIDESSDWFMAQSLLMRRNAGDDF